ncbi:MAG: hypothetical protein CBC84_002110 [Pelagibacteraceae bacterium TMED124]|nr:MAG: hypothetical protein CBC84_002110 [Pelagibacteraceae bacterium TMED124]|tara:strand:- start:3291 stop:3677 length:387 start_codon:yes stop_codon:yes gene_type:complete
MASCSDSNSIDGDWVLSKDTITSSLSSSNNSESYREKELIEKLSTKINTHVVYSFKNDGSLDLTLNSDADSVRYVGSYIWKKNNDIISISDKSGSLQAFSFNIVNERMTLIALKDSSNKITLNRVSYN